MNDFDDILRDGLAADAAGVDPGHGDLARVHRVAGARRRRARLTVSAGTVVLLVAAAIGVRAATPHSADERTPVKVGGEQPSPSVTAGEPVHDPLPLVPSSTTWKAEAVPAGQGPGSLSMAGRRVRGTGPLVALSTAPGSAPADLNAPVGADEWLYRSNDGVHWTGVSMAGSAIRGDQRWLTDLDQRGDMLVGVGTAAATVPTGEAPVQGAVDLVVSTSSDGGATFHDDVLPFDLRGANAQLKASIYLGFGASVAAGEHGTMVALTLAAPPSVVLPADAASSPIRFAPDGIQVLDPPPCSPYPAASTLFATIPFAPATTAAGAGPPLTPATVTVTAPAAAGDGSSAFPSGFTSVPEVVVPSGVDSVPGPADGAAPVGASDSGCGSDAAVTTTAAATVRHTYTWRELRLGDAAVAALTGAPLVFYAADGEHFSRVALPDHDGGAHACGLPMLTATASGFAVAVGRCGPTDGYSGMVDYNPSSVAARSTDVYRTTDGVALDALDPLPFDGIQLSQDGGLVGVGDTVVLQARDGAGRSVVAVAERSSWTMYDVGRSIEAVVGGPISEREFGCCVLSNSGGGVVLVAQAWTDRVAADPPTFHDGGITLRMVDLIGTIDVVDDATGEVVYHGSAGAAAGRVRVAAEASGTPPQASIAPAAGQTRVDAGLPYGSALEVLGADGAVRARFPASGLQALVPVGTSHVVVLHSADGVTWSGEQLAAPPGQTITGVNNVAVLGDTIVVSTSAVTTGATAANSGGGDGELGGGAYKPAQTVAFVGSFR